MPITWNPENVSRLFLVTLAVHHITMDYKRIAAAFGEEASPRAIEEKMKKLRKEARDISGIPGINNKRRRKDIPGSFNGIKAKGGIGKNPRGRPKGSTKGKGFGTCRRFDGDDSETEEKKLFGDLMEAHIIKKEKEEREQRERVIYGVVDPRLIKQESEMQAEHRFTSFFQLKERFEGLVQPKIEEAIAEQGGSVDTPDTLLQPKVEPDAENGIHQQQPELVSPSLPEIQPKVEPAIEAEIQPKLEEVEFFGNNVTNNAPENDGGEVQILLEEREMENFIDLSLVPLANDLEKLVESVVLTDEKNNDKDEDEGEEEVTEVDSNGKAIRKALDKADSESGKRKENINIKKEERPTSNEEDNTASNSSDCNLTPKPADERIDSVPFKPLASPAKDTVTAIHVPIKREDLNADDVIIIL